jgi:phosphopantetheinyl transferase (holo-ACP synthase)
MSDLPPDVVTVNLRFGVMTTLGLYQDTLSFSEDEWAKRDPDAIAKAKQQLADTWVAFRTPQIAEEQKLATQAGIDAKIAEYQQQIADLQVAVTDLQDAAVAVTAVAAPLSVA